MTKMTLLFKETVFVSVEDPLHVQDFHALVNFKKVRGPWTLDSKIQNTWLGIAGE